ncbi:MAG: spermidine synthase, partial [Elusimicrobia bacterium]|nr:spermidine synthase [Elusimicrobiota bacterium]
MVLLGATSLSMQIVLLRELFTIFSGNELTIGIVMSLWMVLVGAGAAVSGRIISKIKSLTKSPAKSLADIFGIYRTIILVISVFLPAVIFLTKIIRPLLQGTPFETLGMTHTMFFSLCLLSPMCILLGSWFSAGTFTGVSAGRVYFLEAVGAILGGLITSFLLIKHFSSMQIAAGFSIVNFLLLIPLSVSRITVIPPMPPDGTPAQHTPLPRGIHLRKFVNPQAVVSIFFLFLFSIILFSGEIVKIDGLAGEIQWKPFTLVESKNSLYGNIVVLGPPQGRHAKGEKHLRGQHSGARHDLSDGHYDFYENGGKLFSTQERQQPEEIVHFAMFLCPNSQKVLLIGGGLSGNLYEVLKHPLRKVMLVELDPMLVSMAKKYLPPEDITALSDSRVEIFFGDGRYFTKTAVRRAEKYDCVIVDMPDPTTGLVSRFYTEEFFREIKSLLSDDGVFITGLSSADGYMSPEMRYLSAGLYKTIKKVFGGCSLVPGVKNYFISGNISGVPAPALADLLVSQKFHLTYLTPFYVRYVLGETRVQTLSDQVTEREEEVSLSRDFQPVNYFYGIMLQASYSGRSFVSRMEWLMKNRRTLLAGAFAGAVIVIISLWFQIRRRQKVGLQAERLRAGITLLAVACT